MNNKNQEGQQNLNTSITNNKDFFTLLEQSFKNEEAQLDEQKAESVMQEVTEAIQRERVSMEEKVQNIYSDFYSVDHSKRLVTKGYESYLNILDQYYLQKINEVLKLSEHASLNVLKIKAMTPFELTEKEYEVFKNISALKNIYEFNKAHVLSEYLQLDKLLEPIRHAGDQIIQTVFTKVNTAIREQLSMRPMTDFGFDGRVKTAGSLMFNRISTMGKISDIPDLIGLRAKMDNDSEVELLKRGLLQSRESPLQFNRELSSHVWYASPRIGAGERDTTNMPNMIYQSVDTFAVQKYSQYNVTCFDSIDLQFRTRNNQHIIEQGNANDVIYKNKQVLCFLMRFLVDLEFRKSSMLHIEKLHKTADELRVWFNTHKRKPPTIKKIGVKLLAIEEKYWPTVESTAEEV